ncbi:MAG TPA: phosphocholine cytidylyltransferase family protein [Chromatiales bacterium]|nr:phosphocholine cytidylyltransferase family protein [Chromatiales bacterium]
MNNALALILAAGIGRRAGLPHPKCLLECGGHTLLERHLRLLHASGVTEAILGLGHRAEEIRAAASRCNPGMTLRFVENPRYRAGSVVTLWSLRPSLREGRPVLVMDADVLYDQRMLERLMDSRHENVFLLDREFEDGDEPVRLCVRAGRLVEFRKRAQGHFDYCGESVGFFRFGPEMAGRLADRVEHYVETKRDEAPHEEAIRDLLLAWPEAFGWEEVTGLPWIEIDFPADVARARSVVLPRLLPLP